MAEPITTATETLYRWASALRAVTNHESNPFSRAVETLSRVAEAMGSPIAIVGGLAGIHYRAMITTVDIDIVVLGDQLDVLLATAPEHGLAVKKRSAEGWHTLVYRDEEGEVAIEVVPEGRNSPRDPEQAPPIPTPQSLGVEQGLGFASFPGWVSMKLVANRDKDRYHVVEALKEASQPRIADVVERLRGMPPEYLKEFTRLVRVAEQENQKNW
ncbi:MAG: hypothetical protein R6U98_30160 [Pirellulaceae bacterium]